MITFAFESWDIEQMIAGAQLENAASISMLRKLGMQQSHQARVWAPVRTRYETCVFSACTKRCGAAFLNIPERDFRRYRVRKTHVHHRINQRARDQTLQGHPTAKTKV